MFTKSSQSQVLVNIVHERLREHSSRTCSQTFWRSPNTVMYPFRPFLRYRTVRYSTVPYGTEQYVTVSYGTVPYRTVLWHIMTTTDPRTRGELRGEFIKECFSNFSVNGNSLVHRNPILPGVRPVPICTARHRPAAPYAGDGLQLTIAAVDPRDRARP